MSTPFNAATNAYGNAARLITQAGKLNEPLGFAVNSSELGITSTPGADFASMLAESVQSVVDTGRVSEQLSRNMVDGKANVVDVVTAISQTEMAMESMVTIRDRVISAYEEIMRMPI